MLNFRLWLLFAFTDCSWLPRFLSFLLLLHFSCTVKVLPVVVRSCEAPLKPLIHYLKLFTLILLRLVLPKKRWLSKLSAMLTSFPLQNHLVASISRREEWTSNDISKCSLQYWQSSATGLSSPLLHPLKARENSNVKLNEGNVTLLQCAIN